MKNSVKVVDKGWTATRKRIDALAAERRKEVAVGILAASGDKPKKLSEKQKGNYKGRQSKIRSLLGPIREAKIAAFKAGDKEAHATASAYLKYGKQKLGVNATNHKASQSALTILQIAQWIEFGTDTQPARPVIRGYADKYGKALQRAISAMTKDAYKGKLAPEVILLRIGTVAVGGMQQFIANDGEGTYPGNAASTLAAKAPGTTPNVNTGQYRSSIAYAVRERGK